MKAGDLVKILLEQPQDYDIEIMVADPLEDPNFYMFTDIDPDVGDVDYPGEHTVVINAVLRQSPPTNLELHH